MSRKSIIFDDKNINKSNFYKNKKVIQLDNVDVYKILVFKKESDAKKYSSRYFIAYDDNDDIMPLFLKFPQMIGHAKYPNSNGTMSLQVSDKRLLKKAHQNMGKNWQFHFKKMTVRLFMVIVINKQ